jgi:myo-inositol-1(or 4)-monophosphatase
MIREAGGLVGDFDGEESYMESGRIVATNAKLFTPLLQLLKAR